MRKQLSTINNTRQKFTGTFERFGEKSGWQGNIDFTLLLTDVKDQEGKLMTEHLWFNLTKQFNALKLQEGDVVEFHARVKRYFKGYRGYREDIYDKPVETDYKLSHPTKIKLVSRCKPTHRKILIPAFTFR